MTQMTATWVLLNIQPHPKENQHVNYIDFALNYNNNAKKGWRQGRPRRLDEPNQARWTHAADVDEIPSGGQVSTYSTRAANGVRGERDGMKKKVKKRGNRYPYIICLQICSKASAAAAGSIRVCRHKLCSWYTEAVLIACLLSRSMSSCNLLVGTFNKRKSARRSSGDAALRRRS